MTHEEETQFKELKEQVKSLETKLTSLCDHLVGTLEKPGYVRIVERISQDLYDKGDGIMDRIKVLENDKRWVLGGAAGVGLVAGLLPNWIRSWFTK